MSHIVATVGSVYEVSCHPTTVVCSLYVVGKGSSVYKGKRVLFCTLLYLVVLYVVGKGSSVFKGRTKLLI